MGDVEPEATIKTMIDRGNAVREDILLTSRRHTFCRGGKLST